MRRLTSFSVGALCVGLVAAWTHAEAQQNRSQQMAFGGGTQFEFLIPVQAQGPLFIEATWNSDANISANLYTPYRSHPIAAATGDGRIALSHTVTSWKAGDEYMLRLTLEQPDPEIKGNLRVVYPSGNRPGTVVAWRNAGPTGTALAGMISRLAELETAVAQTQTAALTPTDRREFDRMIRMLDTRLDVLTSVPAKFVRNDVPRNPAPKHRPSIALPQWDDAVAVSFVGLECIDNKPWHVNHEADEPYLVTAIIPGIEGAVVGGRTPVFHFIKAGDTAEPSVGSREMARVAANGDARIAVALLEREDGNVERSVQRFRRALELFAMYEQVTPQPVAVDDFNWFMTLTADAGESVIGAPQLLTVTPRGIFDPHGSQTAWAISDENGSNSVQQIRFTGLGADYQVAVQVSTEPNNR
ncbi:MAG: hypothetical protein OER90_09205 [Gemmatimonadota bacterium]|nr:hypothetical protein [Gemmatimonadota bacterium]